MESCPQFNLRWNNHSFNIIQVFMEQLSSESLVDVTLSCQGQFLKAHKMILSACSPYFQDLFAIHQVQHPVVILNGINFHDLKIVVEFMYRGETRVLDSELNDILAVAETLQIKGLCTVRDKYDRVPMQEASINESLNSDEPYICNTTPELNESDPLELTTPVEPLKPPRKRKRPSEVKCGSIQPEILSSDSPIFKAPASKASTPRSKAPKLMSKTPSPKAISRRPSLPRASSPRVSNLQDRSSSLVVSSPSEETQTVSSPEAPKVSLKEVSPSRKTSNASKSRSSKVCTTKTKKSSIIITSPSKEIDRENTEVLPFVQVALSEPSDDDIDLARTIKVEPLFIRDIDDNDTSWDDPSRLVIDLPREDLEARKDEPHGQGSILERDESQPSRPIKTTFVFKPKLKVRSECDLVGDAQYAQRSADITSSDQVSGSVDEKGPDLHCNERRKGNKIPRPPNAFMIFANEWRRKLALENPLESNKQISVRLGMKWKNLTTENKAIYFTASRKADEEHKQKYPNYFYSPKEARLRKSQMQALRQKVQSKNVTVSPKKKTGSTIVVPIKNSDPLELTTSFNYETPAVYISNITDANVSVKEELLEDESNPQNLEEEFLNMVEEGHVEAEVHEEEGECSSVPDTQVDKDNQSVSQ